MPEQRLFWLGLLLGMSMLGTLSEYSLYTLSLALGRTLEMHLGVRFLRKLPRLRDAYYRSHLVSDLAERAHGI